MKIKKFIALTLACVMLISAFGITSSAALKNGDIVNYVLYTDIVTYINGYAIQSYNIDGYTAVVVEDLSAYGFSVIWNSGKRTLSVTRDTTAKFTANYTPSTNTHKIGSRAMPVLYTDIVTYLDGKKDKYYKVGGRKIIYVDDLAEFYAQSYVWSAGKRTLSMTLSGVSSSTGTTTDTTTDTTKYNWSTTYSERDSSLKTMNYGFSFTLQNDGKGSYTGVSSDGSAKAVQSVQVSGLGVGFTVDKNSLTIVGNTLSALNSYISICPSGAYKTVTDTTAVRSALSKLFTVKINGKTITGKLEYTVSSGYMTYFLYFDTPYAYSDLKTLSIAVGEIKTAEETITVSESIKETLSFNYIVSDGTNFKYMTVTNSYRLPQLDLETAAAKAVNTAIINDFESYSFLGGSTNGTIYRAFKNSANTLGYVPATDYTYPRTIDYTVERSDGKIVINVTYTIQTSSSMSPYYDTFSYSYDTTASSWKNLGKTATNYVTSVNDYKNLSGASTSDLRYRYLYAFFSGDTQTLEVLGGVASGMYSGYKSLVFGRYAIMLDSSNRLQTTFYVSSSGVDGIAEGWHTCIVTETNTGIILNGDDINMSYEATGASAAVSILFVLSKNYKK